VGRESLHAAQQIIVRLPSDMAQQARHRLLADQGLTPVCPIPQLGVEVMQFPAAREVGEVVAELARCSPPVWAEPNPLCWVALAEPNDPAYHEMIDDLWVQWPPHQLAAVSAWSTYPDHYFTAAERPQDAPIVAVVDTGMDPDHPDFMNPGATGTDVTQGGQLMLSAARTFLADHGSDLLPEATDEHGHGTHLGGIVAAASNNGLTAGDGVAGLGYPARLLPLKVTLANGVATHADVARAIIYAADQGASVILVGLEGPTWSQTLQEAVDYAWQRGCLLVAPAGNSGDDAPIFPASCPHVFGVGATDAEQRVADYSSQGDQVALAAPGGDAHVGVYSTLPTYACTLRADLTTPAYGWLFGGSQAAAHVAGAAALYAGLAGLRPETGEEGALIWEELQASASCIEKLLPASWAPRAGYGLVAPASLLAGERAGSGGLGSLVGRVLASGLPELGATVTATSEETGEAVSVTALWPAGGYRMANLPPGRYRVTAEADGMTGVWERALVRPGCDHPAVDFVLGGPPAEAALLAAEMPKAALRGRPVEISVTYENSGAGTWTRRDGYMLAQESSDRPLADQPDHADLSRDETVAPGESRLFRLRLDAPDDWGLYTTAWRMCQQGGLGWFGPTASETISVTSFWDVPADHWAAAAVEAARVAGIVRGYEGDLYQPTWPVSREQMAVYLARALLGGDASVPTGPAEPSFPDVPPDHWAFRHIEYVKAQQIAAGYRDGTYQPTLALDRAQMAVFVARAIVPLSERPDLPSYSPPTTPFFPDVTQDSWAYRFVEYLAQDSVGVIQGYLDGLYHPERPCTRDQMAVYVARAFELPT